MAFLSYISCAVGWFNPLVWVALNQVKTESELAADDLVISSGVVPTAYATILVELVRLWQGKPASKLAIGMISEPGGIADRVSRSLNEKICRKTPSRWQVAGLIAMSSLALVTCSGIRLVSAQVTLANPVSKASTQTVDALDFKTIHPLGNRDWYFICEPSELGQNRYPYNNTFTIRWAGGRPIPPNGTWIKITRSDSKYAYARYADYIFLYADIGVGRDLINYFGTGPGNGIGTNSTWQFVPADAVPPGPWISTKDDPKTFSERSLQSRAFNRQLKQALITRNFSPLKTLWETQPMGVFYCSKFVYAVSQNCSPADLDALLATGEPINPPQEEVSPLAVAVAEQNLPLLTWLLDHGATRTMAGADRPLEMAAKIGNVKLVDLLIHHGIRDVHVTEVADPVDSPVHESIIDLLDKNNAFMEDHVPQGYSLWRVANCKDAYLLKTLIKEGFSPVDSRGLPNNSTPISLIRQAAQTDRSLAPILAILEGANKTNPGH